MTTAYTSLLGLALPVTGELSGTWGDTVNTSITSLLDSAVAGTTNLSTDADVTLTTTTGAANTAREAILLFSGARTVLRTVTAPAQSKVYTVINATTGGFSVKLVGAGPTTGVTIVAGESAVCAWNGSDFVKVSNTGGTASFTNVTVTGTTTLSGLTASTALALDASKNVVSVTNTGTGSNVLAVSPTLTGTTSIATLNLTNALGTVYGGTGLTSFTSGGVVYASSSSALATGSALTFDGTTLTNSGGTNTINKASGLSTLNLATAGTTTANFVWDNNNGYAYIGTTAVASLAFNTGGSEGMRLTSTGLGIGTSSPAYKLDVAGTVKSAGTGYNGATSPSIILANTTASTGRTFILNSYNTGGFQIADETASGATRMSIDSSGNLGLGVTPSAWYTTGGTSQWIEMPNGVSFGDYGGSTTVGNNWFANTSGGDIYKITGYAAQYVQTSGTHVWKIAAVGNAGDAITFTQAMTLDASGRLGIGTTSPTTDLSITNSAGPIVRLVRTSNRFELSADTDFMSLNARDASTYITFKTADTERCRIDSSGNLLVGTTTAKTTTWSGSGNGMTIGGAVAPGLAVWDTTDATYIGYIYQANADTAIGNNASGNLTFATGNTERCRIDSSGNLLVGKTSTASTSVGFETHQNGTVYSTMSSSANTESTLNIYSTGASAYRFYVGMGGTVYATNTTITAISDQRLKENIRDLDDGLSAVMALKPRKFDWKEGKGANIKDARGFIAQEFETVFPDMIEEWRDPAPEGEEAYKAINANLIPTLVKALQEQQAIIESLKARLDAANL